MTRLPRLSILTRDEYLSELFGGLEDGSVPVGEPSKPRYFLRRRRDAKLAAELAAKPIEAPTFNLKHALDVAHRRLTDTPDRAERLKFARSYISNGLRPLSAKPATLTGCSAERIAREPHRLAERHRAGESYLAIAFIMLGHALGVEHPEDALRTD